MIVNFNDEEKKAIDYWQYIRDTQIYDGYKGQVYAVTLLNLIEKQQKEIERLETRKYMYNAVTGEISQIPVDNNYISKDKIGELRAKIEDKLHVVTPSCSEIEKINEFKNEGAVNILNKLLEE